MGNKFSLADIKVFYDQHGQPHEVLMSYELFQQLETMLWELLSEDDFSSLLDEVWQDQASSHLNADGTPKKGKGLNVENLLEWLDK